MALSSSCSTRPKKTNPTSPKHFHIFGHGISFSRSPLIHTAAFRHYGLPHTYDIRETASINEVASLIDDADFGGASVTMPHKLAVHKFCSQQTEHAQRIGAINTLIVKQDSDGKRFIVGDNTDWSGLHSIITTKTKSWSMSPRTGLVIGAGGASRAALYALHQSGLKQIYLVNRTMENAKRIATDFREIFHITVVADLHALPAKPDIIIGTIPADKTVEDDFRCLFDGTTDRGLCIDMAYKPRRTPLLAVAETHPEWSTVPGIEVLLYQGFDQLQLWTGLTAPREVMQQAMEDENQQIDAPARGEKL